ncbi:universal stress protein [Roseomonas sp. PWR1]|uniref:Universal stress protein n=1 Tax=Roseomonas nitratireducens TaxID=2820810 RepID=A0ABS4AMC0_9PROT|nr:universal stress protein [Neoroseomonas nitratireducens]MBP0462513.1 universal stress protein [Neoroseomonas nitratireducens]
MIRSILVALDDTPGAVAARDHSIALARRTGAALAAATVLDWPHAMDAHEAVPPGGGAFKERRDAARARRLEEEAEAAFAACAAAAGDLGFERLRLTEAPEPALLAAGAAHDLVVIGRDSTLGLEETEHGLAPVIEALLHDGARPLLVVPPGAPPAEGGVLVGYDGSIPAMRALQLFALLGLAEGSPTKVLSLDEDAAAAARLAGEGAAFLRRHGIAAEALPVTGTHPVDALLTEAAAMPARLLVMGAYEHSGLRTLFTGSATQKLLRAAPCAVFVAH